MKTSGDRVGELTGSMLAAAAIAMVLTVVMTAIGGESLDNSPNSFAGPAWLWLMTTVGSWLVLAAGKVCERTSGDRSAAVSACSCSASSSAPSPSPAASF